MRRHGGQPDHHLPRPDAGRRAGADEGRYSISGIPWSARRQRQGRQALSAFSPTATCASPTTTAARVELMTRKLITVREASRRKKRASCCTRTASRSCWWSTTTTRCVGLITVKDIEKATLHPNACRDEKAACASPPPTTSATGASERAERLIDAGVDCVVVDRARPFAKRSRPGRASKRRSNAGQVIAGNVATAEGAQALIDAGADAVKIGIGPGLDLHDAHRGGRRRAAAPRSWMRRRPRQNRRAGDRRRRHQIFRRSRQGDRRPPDCVMIGSLLAGTDETPRRGVPVPGPLLQGLSRHGFGRRDGARGSADRYFQWTSRPDEAVPKASRARCPIAVRSRRSSPARRRPARGDGLSARRRSRNPEEAGTFEQRTNPDIRCDDRPPASGEVRPVSPTAATSRLRPKQMPLHFFPDARARSPSRSTC